MDIYNYVLARLKNKQKIVGGTQLCE